MPVRLPSISTCLRIATSASSLASSSHAPTDSHNYRRASLGLGGQASSVKDYLQYGARTPVRAGAHEVEFPNHAMGAQTFHAPTMVRPATNNKPAGPL
jgi:hypothetical protein